MPTASADFDPFLISPDLPPVRVAVCRYDPDAAGDVSPYTILPNVRVTDIHIRQGATPPAARFRYVFDETADPRYPRQIEQVYPLDAAGRNVVKNDDRLAVLRFLPAGRFDILFDGYAQIPQVDLSPEGQEVSFQALDVSVREWDKPLSGPLIRDAGDPVAGGYVQTDAPARFNPAGKPNGTPDGADAGTAGQKFPVFLDPLIVRKPDQRRSWSLGMAARYVMYQGNPKEKYLKNYDSDILAEILDDRRPLDGQDFYDPDDPATYLESPIAVHDYDCMGDCWPDAFEKITEPHGFAFRFGVRADKDGKPLHFVRVYRRDGKLPLKSLALQPYGDAVLDPGQTNVGTMHLARDIHGLANQVRVDVRPDRFEASVILTPDFVIGATDYQNLDKYIEGKDGFDRTFYRKFVFGEAGDPYWNFATSAMTSDGKPVSLAKILGGPKADESLYAVRRRVPIKTLFSKDADGKPYQKQLWVSTDYAGPVPGVWDRSGKWQQIVHGGWDTLDDRLGIEITANDPNSWSIGAPPDGVALMPFQGGFLNVVESLSRHDAAAGFPRFYFRLTCVIEGDKMLEALAKRRGASPTTFTVERRIEARDRFRREIVSATSHLQATGKDIITRDDTDKAKAHATAVRAAHERARLAGSITIPRFTTAYELGDRIKQIAGRDISLRTNVGADQKEAAEYPVVVGITWTFEGKQSTQLLLDDTRADVAPFRQK